MIDRLVPGLGRPARAALVLGAALAVLWLAYLSVFQVDDAFIVYRYARNLAHGEGFVFNPGERVEGVTCFLWTLVLAPFVWLGLPLPAVGPVLSALCGAAALAVCARIAARVEGREAVAAGDLWAPLLLLAHPAFAYWSVGGLETVPYALLLLLAYHDHLGERRAGGGARSALWTGLALLTRPEAPLLAGVLAVDRAAAAFSRRQGGRGRLRPLLVWLAIVAGIGLAFLAFRRLYFADWLPNTYYAKTGGDPGETRAEGWRYTRAFLATLVPSPGALSWWAPAAGIAIVLGLVLFGFTRAPLRAAAALVLLHGLAVTWEGGDWMVLHRFWVPALPFVVLLLLAAGRAAVRRLPALAVPAIAVAVLLAIGGVRTGLHERNGPTGLAVHAAGNEFAHQAVGRWLAAHGAPGDLVALMDVGRVGWEAASLRVLDISGLTDREIARAPGGFVRKRYPPAKVLDRKPRFVVLVEFAPIDIAIAADPGFRRGYRLRFERNHRFNWEPRDAYYLQVFERLPEADVGVGELDARIAADPEDDVALTARARRRRAAGDLDGAAADLARAAEVSRSPDALDEQLDTLIAAGRAGDARAALQASPALEPGRPGAYVQAGFLAWNRGDKDGAIALWQDGLTRIPDAKDLARNLAFARYDRGEYAEAAALYRRAVELEPLNWARRSDLAWALLKQGKGEEARAECRTVLEHLPDEGGARAVLAQLESAPAPRAR